MFNAAVLYFRLSLEKYLRSKIRREKRERETKKGLQECFQRLHMHKTTDKTFRI